MKPELKDQKHLTLTQKPIRLKFQNIQTENSNYDSQNIVTKDNSKLDDKLNDFMKWLHDSVTRDETGVSFLEKCQEMMDQYRKTFEEQIKVIDRKQKFRVKSIKKCNNIDKVNEDVDLQNGFSPTNSGANLMERKSHDFKRNISQHVHTFSRIKLKKTNDRPIVQIGGLTVQNPILSDISNIQIYEINQLDQQSTQTKKTNKICQKISNNEKMNNKLLITVLQQKIKQLSQQLNVQQNHRIQIQNQLDVKEYEIEQYKSKCRLFQAQIEKMMYQRNINQQNFDQKCTVKMQFYLNLLQEDSQQCLRLEQMKENQNKKELIAYLTETVQHLQLIVVSGAQQFDKLKDKLGHMINY